MLAESQYVICMQPIKQLPRANHLILIIREYQSVFFFFPAGEALLIVLKKNLIETGTIRHKVITVSMFEPSQYEI